MLTLSAIMGRVFTSSIALFVVLLFSACDSDLNPTKNPSDTSADLQLVIPAKLTLSVVRVEYVVSGEGMVDMRGELSIVGNMARGRIEGIDPGPDRLFVLNVYNAEGLLTHKGSATAEIVAGQLAEVRISLLPLSGSAEVNGDFGDAPLFSKTRELLGTWQLDLGDDAEFSYRFRGDGRFENRIGGVF